MLVLELRTCTKLEIIILGLAVSLWLDICLFLVLLAFKFCLVHL